MGRSVAILGTRGYPSFYGGFETAVRNLAPYLADRGWDVSVYGRPGTTAPGAERHPAVRSIVTPGLERKALSTLSHGYTATRHALRTKPDVALVMNVANGPFVRRLERAGIPTVVNVDGIEWEREKWGRLARMTFLHGARLTARHATELVMDAHEISRRWQSEFGRGGVFVPYGGVPFDGPPPLDLTPGAYALVVARFVPENSIPQFFEAAQALADRIEVVIVGSSGYGGVLDERAAALDAAHAGVRWLGHVSDDRLLHSLWQHAGAYFHGHSVGGTNPALVQAMACGAPVIALDTPFNREVLADAGRYTSADPAMIARSVLELVGDPEAQHRMGAAGRSRAASLYAWEQVNADYEAALVAAIERRKVDDG